MVKKATLGMLVVLLMCGLIGLSAKALTASPSQAVITVSGVPTGTQGLAVEVTVDTSVVTLGSATSSVSGALAVTGSMSEGVGIISTSGDLPATFTITVPLTGVAAGTSMIAVGNVLDKIGGTAISGASAAVDASSVSVASSSSTSSTGGSTSTSGGVGGLDNDTITVTINGTDVNSTSALNVTLAFSDATVAVLGSANPTFTGTGASQLLTASDPTKNLITAVWSGNITDGVAVLTAMLEPGTATGTTMISVSKVEAAGGTDITSSVAPTVSPDTVTNSTQVTTSDCGTFGLIGPDSVTGPGKAAVAFTVEGAASDLSATLNGSKVELVGGKTAGVAIVTVPASGSLSLALKAKCGSTTQDISLGSVEVDAGTGKKPSVKAASASNKSTGTKLTITGKKFSKTDTSVEIIPTDRIPSADPKVKGASIKATYDASECIPNGSYVNVTTPAGIGAKKIKVRGSCTNSLVE